MIFIQRTGTSADVPYTGDSARVVDTATGAVIVDWTAGGVLQDVPQGSGYRLEIRTGQTVASDQLAIGAVVFTIGQSNIERWYSTPTALGSTAGTYMMQANGTIGAVQGAAAAYFAANYAAEAGVPVLMVAAAKGGTALTQAADKGNGYWLDTSQGSLYSNALALLARVGGRAEAVLWAQGETDASSGAGISQSVYATALNTFMNRVLADFGVDKVLIQEIGPRGDNGDTYDAVRAAQHEVADAMAGVDIGALTTDLNTIEDGIHLSGASRVMAADRLLDGALRLAGVRLTRTVRNGGASSDTLAGGGDRDEIHGLDGNDVILGEAGSDALFGDGGNDTIRGGSGTDLIRGDAGDDSIDGGADADVISGGNGNDLIDGGSGSDEVWADAGDDTVIGGVGNDVLYAGGGTDTAVFRGNFTDYSIMLSGTTARIRDLNVSDGDEGSDFLDGFEFAQFNDRRYDLKGTGLPPLFSDEVDAIDFANVAAGTNLPTSLYKALGGNDEVYLPKDAAAAQAAGYDTTQIFDAGAGDDVVIGGSLNDTIRGGDGDDILNGGAGSDRLEGGLGDDRYYVDTTAVGSAGDLVVEAANAGTDLVFSTVTFTLKSNGEHLTLIGADSINGTGNELANVISGNEAANIVNGNAGDDTLMGNGGNDQLRGGIGNDIIDGGAGRDVAIYAGRMSDYRIVDESGFVTVTDLNPADGADEGTDHVSAIEQLRFSDGTYTVTIPNRLFTEGADTLDFATVPGNSYATGTQYAALAGNDAVYLPKDATAAQAAGYDTTQIFDAGAGDDVVIGGGLSDTIRGGDGNDTLDGGAGSDRLEGGLGDDVYLVDTTAVGSAGDLVVEAANAGTDLVLSTVTVTLKSNVENLTLTGTGDISGFGNDLDNVVTGNEGRNSLKGDAGNDVLSGLGGDDNLTGGLGNDTIDGGAGHNTAVYGGNRAGYQIAVDVNGRASVTDSDASDGDEGTDQLVNVALLKFLDGTLTLVTPANTAPTGITLSTDHVAENSPAGTRIGTLTAQDADLGDTFAFTLLDDAGGSVVLQGADLLVAPGAVLDYETSPSLPIRVRVTDGAGHVLDQMLHVALDNLPGSLVTGTTAADSLTGTVEDDRIDGGAGADTMAGGAGNDTYVVDNSRDRIVELIGGGTDAVESAVSYTLGDNIEILTLTGTASNATGNALRNTLIGNARNNILDGGAGADTLKGGVGNDSYIIDDPADAVVEAANEGTDTVKTSLTGYALVENVENLLFVGTGGFLGIGNSLTNTIQGGAGNDTLDGGEDGLKDNLKGGAGDDLYIVRASDSVSEASGAGDDTVMTALTSYKLPTNVERLIFTGSGSFKGTGNASDNLIQGGDGADTLDGGTGNDTLAGGAGADTYLVDARGDVVWEFRDHATASGDAGGIDTVLIKTGLTAYTLLSGSNVENLTYAGTGAFEVRGNELDNRLTTAAGNDTLVAGDGHDTLMGGSGADLYVFEQPNDVDVIIGFSRSQGDRIVISRSGFGLAADTTLSDDWLVTGMAAQTAAHGQFLLDPNTNTLFWDGDGNGAGEAVALAQFAGSNVSLKATDIVLV